MEERLGVAVPWNLPSYISANGFHPLYQALFEGNEYLRLSALDEAALARELERETGLYRAILQRRARLARDLAGHFTDNQIGRKFLKHVTLDELTLGNEIPGEVELHHTCPFASGRRPFVLHCESFLPVFQPFLWQGMGQAEDLEAIRSFYARIFRSDACLGIFSHVPDTLKEFKRFFADPAIDAKLHASRVGLADSRLRVLAGHRRRSDGEPPVFLFASSFHDNPGNFRRRGGVAALTFAERYLRSGGEGAFIFRAKRPADEEFADYGLDPAFFAHADGRGITWIEDYVPTDEQLRLFAIADFVLLPSMNLHSATIMQALAAGAVPVVSDTVGTEVYVSDSENGIVLNGMRRAVWRRDTEGGIWLDAQEMPAGLERELVEQIHRRVVELLDEPEKLAAMRRAAREVAQTRFSGAQYRDTLSESIVALWRQHEGGGKKPRRGRAGLLVERAMLSDEECAPYFASPSQPRVALDVGTAKVYALRAVYYFLPGGLNADLNPFVLNPFTLRALGHSRLRKILVVGALEELFGPIFFALSQSKSLLGRIRYVRLRLVEAVKKRLRPHRRMYRLVRSAYRLVLSAVRGALRPLSRRY